MIREMTDTSAAARLFGDWQESLLWSCLEGVMGKLYAPEQSPPLSVMAMLGDFLYFAGKPDRELVSFKPDWCRKDFVIMVPQDEAWGEMIRDVYGTKATGVTRYAIRKDTGKFDSEKLRKVVVQLPEEYSLRLIDEKYYELCLAEEWSRDFVAQFENYPMFEKLGLGVVAVKDGRIVSGASSYSRYREGIEIEIGTREEFRRRGLAYACGARLILECTARNLYPSWDAQNKWSVALAEKLGYQFSHEYPAYEIRGY